MSIKQAINQVFTLIRRSVLIICQHVITKFSYAIHKKSDCLSVRHLSFCWSFQLSVCSFVCMSAFLSTGLFIGLVVCLSACLPVSLLVFSSVCLFVCLHVCLSLCCFFFHLSVSLFVCLHVCLSLCMTFSLPFSLSVCLSISVLTCEGNSGSPGGTGRLCRLSFVSSLDVSAFLYLQSYNQIS